MKLSENSATPMSMQNHPSFRLRVFLPLENEAFLIKIATKGHYVATAGLSPAVATLGLQRVKDELELISLYFDTL